MITELSLSCTAPYSCFPHVLEIKFPNFTCVTFTYELLVSDVCHVCQVCAPSFLWVFPLRALPPAALTCTSLQPAPRRSDFTPELWRGEFPMAFSCLSPVSERAVSTLGLSVQRIKPPVLSIRHGSHSSTLLHREPHLCLPHAWEESGPPGPVPDLLIRAPVTLGSRAAPCCGAAVCCSAALHAAAICLHLQPCHLGSRVAVGTWKVSSCSSKPGPVRTLSLIHI